jgi:hypothetical protein
VKKVCEQGYCAHAKYCDADTYAYYDGVFLTSVASLSRRTTTVSYTILLSGANSHIPTSGAHPNTTEALSSAIQNAASKTGLTLNVSVSSIAEADVTMLNVQDDTTSSDKTVMVVAVLCVVFLICTLLCFFVWFWICRDTSYSHIGNDENIHEYELQ